MGFIEWTAALSVGIDDIDAQHKALVALINKLYEAKEAGRGREALAGILRELEDYVQYHFGLEEDRFAAVKYPEAKTHIAEHRAFTERLSHFELSFALGKAELDSELLSYLKTWLTRHIAFSDRKYRPYLADLS